MLFYDGIKVYMQNGKLDDVEIAYYINKIRKTHKGKILKRISFILGEGYIDLRYSSNLILLKEYGEFLQKIDLLNLLYKEKNCKQMIVYFSFGCSSFFMLR